MTVNHTPGPWKYGPWVHEDDEGNQAGRFLKNDDGEVVAYVDVSGLEANAHILKASVELYEALRDLGGRRGRGCFCPHGVDNPMVRGCTERCLKAQAALAKAEGREPDG